MKYILKDFKGLSNVFSTLEASSLRDGSDIVEVDELLRTISIPNASRSYIRTLATVFQSAIYSMQALYSAEADERDIQVAGMVPGKLFFCNEHGIPAGRSDTKTCWCLFNKLEKITERFSKVFSMCHVDQTSGVVSKKKNISIWWLGTEQFLYHAYIACLNFSYRPRITTFEEEITTCCSVISKCMSSKKKVEKVMNVRPGIAAEIILRFKAAGIIYSHRKKEIRQGIRRVLQYCGYNRDAGTLWLLMYKICFETVLRIESARNAMMSETNHRAPYNAVAHIARHCPYDFHVIADFFREKWRFQSIRSAPLDIQTVRKQIQNAHKTFNYVEQGGVLPAIATTHYYCRKHMRFNSHLVGTSQGNAGYLNTQSIGGNRIAVDPINGGMYCAMRQSRNPSQRVHGFSSQVNKLINDITEETIKSVGPSEVESSDKEYTSTSVEDILMKSLASSGKRMSETMDMEDEESSDSDEESDEDKIDSPSETDMIEEIEDEDLGRQGASAATALGGRDGGETGEKNPNCIPKYEKRGKRGLAKKSCAGKKLCGENMLGIIKTLGKTSYLLCPYCVRLMKYTKEKWTEIGLWCGSCLNGQRDLAKRYGIMWDEKNGRPYDYVYPRTIGPYPLYWNPVDLSCIICESRSTETRPMSFCLIYNDLVDPDELRQETQYTKSAAQPQNLYDRLSSMRSTGRLGYYPLCRKHSKPYVSMTPQSMRLSNLMYLSYRLSSALLHGDEYMAKGLEPRFSATATGDINILECMDSTALFYEATCRKRRELEQDIMENDGSEALEEFRSTIPDNDALFVHSSTSKFRKKYTSEGDTDSRLFADQLEYE